MTEESVENDEGDHSNELDGQFSRNRKRDRDWDKKPTNLGATSKQTNLLWKKNPITAPSTSTASPNWIDNLNLEGSCPPSTSKEYTKNITKDTNFWTNVFFPSSVSSSATSTLPHQQTQEIVNLNKNILNKAENSAALVAVSNGSTFNNIINDVTPYNYLPHDDNAAALNYLTKIKRIRNSLSRQKDVEKHKNLVNGTASSHNLDSFECNNFMQVCC